MTMHRQSLAVLLLALPCVGCSLVSSARDGDAPDPLASGEFFWTASEPLLTPLQRPGDNLYSIKDPTVVQHDGRWHVFCTLRGEKRSHQIEQISFESWDEIESAERHILDLTDGYFCAPQVFFFTPQKKWYMVYQVREPSRQPALQPAFSTTTDINDPSSWTAPQLLFDAHPEDVRMWIDFWAICDEEKAHLFFTSHGGQLWRSETRLEDFPGAWSKPEVALRGDFFEASHTYRLQDRPAGSSRYLTLIEARDAERRYYQAYTAERLDGSWTPLAATNRQPFASVATTRFPSEPWTTSISHAELLRSGHDEKLEVDSNDLRFLVQGTTATTEPGANYGEIPWVLGLLEPADPRDVLFYDHWTVSSPVFEPGPAGSFDEVAVKDPTIVFHGGKYHVFYTSKPSTEALRSGTYVDGCGYVSASTLEGLSNAERHDLNAVVGLPVIAPQIFYFEPQALWYLVAQTPVEGKRQLDPIYLTNPDIADVSGWTRPKIIRTSRENPDEFWIDFWVICDERKAHLFYTDHAGSMFRLETPIEDFPHGFDNAPEQNVLTVRGQNSIGQWRLHEASHIYRVKRTGEYLALLEAVYPHPTKRNYWDSRNRFMFAVVADSLEGSWRRVESSPNEFLGDPASFFTKDGSRSTHDQVSHPELIRSGYDQRLEIDDYRLRILMQSFDADGVPDSYDYNELLWTLSVAENH